MFQMTDMLDMAHGQNDQGGASLKMDFLTEEEANAIDAEEYNSLKAYGARDHDLVTFLQVRAQGDLCSPHSLKRMLTGSCCSLAVLSSTLLESNLL